MLEAEHKMKLMFPHRPWETEPDNAAWTDEKLGMRCRIRRNRITLTLCGYVGVPTDNLLWGLTDKLINASKLINAENCWRELDENTHGGLTYAQEDDDGWWWFGFDTAHHDDFAPGLAMSTLGAEGISHRQMVDLYDPADYKTWEFVDAEVRALTRRIYQLTEEILQQQGDDDNDYGPGDRFELGD